MADTKISALADVVTLAADDKVPVADASDLTASKSATMTEVNTYIRTLPLVTTEITGLGAAAALAAANVFPVDQAATIGKATLTQLVTFLQTLGMPQVTQLTSQHALTSSTPTKVTGLDMTLAAASTWIFDYRLIIRAAVATGGPTFNFNFTGTTTKANWWFQYADISATLLAAIGSMAHDTTTNTLGFQMAKAEDDLATTAAGNMGPTASASDVQTAATNIMCAIKGIIVVGASGGDLQLWHGSSDNTNSTSVEVGSSLVAIRTV